MKSNPAGSVARLSARTSRGREDGKEGKKDEEEDVEDKEKQRIRNKSPSVVHNSIHSSPAKEVSLVNLINNDIYSIVFYLRYKKENLTEEAKK